MRNKTLWGAMLALLLGAGLALANPYFDTDTPIATNGTMENMDEGGPDEVTFDDDGLTVSDSDTYSGDDNGEGAYKGTTWEDGGTPEDATDDVRISDTFEGRRTDLNGNRWFTQWVIFYDFWGTPIAFTREVSLWVDANGDGVPQASEVTTVNSSGTLF